MGITAHQTSTPSITPSLIRQWRLQRMEAEVATSSLRSIPPSQQAARTTPRRTIRRPRLAHTDTTLVAERLRAGQITLRSDTLVIRATTAMDKVIGRLGKVIATATFDKAGKETATLRMKGGKEAALGQARAPIDHI